MQDAKEYSPECELCQMPAQISTPRLDGNTEENPFIDLCDSCDRKYQEMFAE